MPIHHSLHIREMKLNLLDKFKLLLPFFYLSGGQVLGGLFSFFVVRSLSIHVEGSLFSQITLAMQLSNFASLFAMGSIGAFIRREFTELANSAKLDERKNEWSDYIILSTLFSVIFITPPLYLYGNFALSLGGEFCLLIVCFGLINSIFNLTQIKWLCKERFGRVFINSITKPLIFYGALLIYIQIFNFTKFTEIFQILAISISLSLLYAHREVSIIIRRLQRVLLTVRCFSEKMNKMIKEGMLLTGSSLIMEMNFLVDKLLAPVVFGLYTSSSYLAAAIAFLPSSIVLNSILKIFQNRYFSDKVIYRSPEFCIYIISCVMIVVANAAVLKLSFSILFPTLQALHFWTYTIISLLLLLNQGALFAMQRHVRYGRASVIFRSVMLCSAIAVVGIGVLLLIKVISIAVFTPILFGFMAQIIYLFGHGKR